MCPITPGGHNVHVGRTALWIQWRSVFVRYRDRAVDLVLCPLNVGIRIDGDDVLQHRAGLRDGSRGENCSFLLLAGQSSGIAVIPGEAGIRRDKRVVNKLRDRFVGGLQTIAVLLGGIRPDRALWPAKGSPGNGVRLGLAGILQSTHGGVYGQAHEVAFGTAVL